MSLVNFSSYELSVENCQPFMDAAEYGRGTHFKLISDLSEPLHIFSVTDTGRIRYRKTMLPGHDHSIAVKSDTSLVFLEKTLKPAFTVDALRLKIIDKNILSVS